MWHGNKMRERKGVIADYTGTIQMFLTYLGARRNSKNFGTTPNTTNVQREICQCIGEMKQKAEV